MAELDAQPSIGVVVWHLVHWCQKDWNLGRAPTDEEFDEWLKTKGL